MSNPQESKPIQQTDTNEVLVITNEKKKERQYQKKVFWLTSIGYNSANLILLNFFQYFAAAIVREGVLGFITAIRNLVSAIFQGNFGRLSDKKGRRFLLVIGFFLGFAATTLLIFAYNQTMLIVIAIVHAFSFSIIIPIWNAVQGDVTESKGRTTFMGKLSSVGQGVGVIIMLILGGIFFILDYFKGIQLKFTVQYSIVFGVAAINLLLCAFGVVFLRETRKFDLSIKQPKAIIALKNKPFRKFILVNFFFGISMAALWPIYPIIQVNILKMEIYQLTIVSVVYAILFSIGSYFGGFIADRIGRKPIIIFSRIFMFSVSLVYIPAVLLNSWYWIILTNVISGVGNGVFLVVMNAYALDMSSEESLGSYSGIAQASWGIATFVGSFITGFIAEAINSNYNELVMVISITVAIAIMRVIASIGYFFIKESSTKNN